MSISRREFVALSAAAALAKQPDTDEIFFAPITELNARLRKKEFSCVELTKAFCDRLEKLGPIYNALSLSLRKDAIDLAKDVDGEIKRDRLRSVLQGIPYGAKDLFSVQGKVTTWGAKPYASQVFDYSATVIKKLEKAKAILIGKLAMVELAGGPSYSGAGASLTGPCLNPWNREHWAGGSSSGSGAAVAAGLVPYALGTETSGSIITPAAYCGITGLRPTYGLVSRYGAMALSPSLDKIGPMCRTAEDCGHVLAVIAGGDGADSLSARKNFYYAPQFARPFKFLKVGYSPAEFDAASDAVKPALKAALDVIRSFGAAMVEKQLPEMPYNDTVSALISAEAGYEFRQLIESGKVDELADQQQIQGLKDGLKITAADYLKAKRIQQEVTGMFAKLLYEVDVYLAPSRLTTANNVNQPFAQQRLGGGRSPLIAASNLAGVPALSLPCGSVNGLPVGIQFLGPHFSENRILSFGVEFQRRTEWHKKHPQV